MVATTADDTSVATAADAEHATGVAIFPHISDTRARDYTDAECCRLRTTSEHRSTGKQRPAVPDPYQQAAGAYALHKVIPTPFFPAVGSEGEKASEYPTALRQILLWNFQEAM